MKTRATLSIDPALHARAKRLARQQKTSVSGLFESYLMSQPDPAGSVVDSLVGSARLKEDTGQSDSRRQRLESKYVH